MLKKICFAALLLSLLFYSIVLADYPVDMWDYDYTSYEEAYNDGFDEGYREGLREAGSEEEEEEEEENTTNDNEVIPTYPGDIVAAIEAELRGDNENETIIEGTLDNNENNKASTSSDFETETSGNENSVFLEAIIEYWPIGVLILFFIIAPLISVIGDLFSLIIDKHKSNKHKNEE